MRIGVPAEIRPGEARVAATPDTIRKLIRTGHHTCLVQASAGIAASIPDGEFEAAGASILPRAAEVYAQSDIVL
jgi:NAD(P) transhydrogenase subunit alpha